MIWLPKYRKRILTGPVAIRARDGRRQIALEHELESSTGKGASAHVPMCIASRPPPTLSQIRQWLQGISSRSLLSAFPHLRKPLWGRHLGARGYLAVSSGNITDAMIQTYIEEQEGEAVSDDSQFQIDP